MEKTISNIVSQQRYFFAQGHTRSLDFRLKQLRKLQEIFTQHEQSIINALFEDLHKSAFESLRDEILLIQNEIDFICRHLKKWMTPDKIKTPIPLWPAKSRIYKEPYGNVLIISPWNFPFLLTFSPVIGAICAGNTVIIKPSEIAPATSHVIHNLITNHFDPRFISVIEGNAEVVTELIEQSLDYIFFTGSTKVGKQIMSAAAKHLTPVSLELGGKSPCIVDRSADIKFAAKRIAWAKTINAGQVCLAPDYLYVHRDKKTELIKQIIYHWERFYGTHPDKSADYGRIINDKHFARLENLIKNSKVLYGGQCNAAEKYISPTIIEATSWNEIIMQEEIFGPILPVIEYHNLNDVIYEIKNHEKPLALYLFSHSKSVQSKIIKSLAFGGGCINDCILHVANFNLPFGGVGSSGSGAYHGIHSFNTFTHRKSIYRRFGSLDIGIEYSPATPSKIWWLKKLLRL